MSIITQIQKAVADGSLVVGKPEVRSMRVYFNNAKRNDRTPIDMLASQFMLRLGGWPLDTVFEAESIKWLQELVLRKDGGTRDTPNTRRLVHGEDDIVRKMSFIRFVGQVALPDVGRYELINHPGHEKLATYSVFIAGANAGKCMHFYHIPWQDHYDRAHTGLCPIQTPTDNYLMLGKPWL